MTERMEYHKPALLAESLAQLAIKPNGVYVDVTFGGGGHSRGILEKLEKGRLFAFDKDEDAAVNRLDDSRFELIRSDFKFIEIELSKRGISRVDGILADLGISSHQIDDPQRGFSYRFDADLDLRMDNREDFSAADLLNTWEEFELMKVFRNYGEIDNARRLAKAIVRARIEKTISTTFELETAIADILPKEKARYLSKLYQALRIAVNDELRGLKTLLESGLRLLAPGGRFAVISYHSLEDRIVKNFFRFGNLEGNDDRDIFGNSLSHLKVITRHAIAPSDLEIKNNPRSRSAKLRAAEKR